MVVAHAVDRVAHLPKSLLCEVGLPIVAHAFIDKATHVETEQWRQSLAEGEGLIVLMVVDFSPYGDGRAVAVIAAIGLLGLLTLVPDTVELPLVCSGIADVVIGGIHLAETDDRPCVQPVHRADVGFLQGLLGITTSLKAISFGQADAG